MDFSPYLDFIEIIQCKNDSHRNNFAEGRGNGRKIQVVCFLFLKFQGSISIILIVVLV